MNQLYENDYMRISMYPNQEILTVEVKMVCDDIEKLDKHLSIINQYVKETKGKHLILQVEKLSKISKESLLYDKFIPFVGECGVKNIAVITGENPKVKTFISELDSYISPLKKQYHIITESFESYDQAFDWIRS